jgi:mRNA degradation ribonuclease J1/J2
MYIIVSNFVSFGPFGNIKMQELQISAYTVLYSVIGLSWLAIHTSVIQIIENGKLSFAAAGL